MDRSPAEECDAEEIHARASRGRSLFSRWSNSLRTISHTTHTPSSINDILPAGESLACGDGWNTKMQRTPSTKRNFVERNFYPLNNPLCRNKRSQKEESCGTASHYDCVRERDGRGGGKADGQVGTHAGIGPVIISTKKTSGDSDESPEASSSWPVSAILPLLLLLFLLLVRSPLSFFPPSSLFLYARQLSSATTGSAGPSAR